MTLQFIESDQKWMEKFAERRELPNLDFFCRDFLHTIILEKHFRWWVGCCTGGRGGG
jgi:hypothetical protein